LRAPGIVLRQRRCAEHRRNADNSQQQRSHLVLGSVRCF
jgi:hypothetical protein